MSWRPQLSKDVFIVIPPLVIESISNPLYLLKNRLG